MRVRLPRVAAIWLGCQLAIFAAAPVTFAATATLVSNEACECPDARLGHACPMHAGSSAETGDPATCHMRGTCATLDVALLTLTSGMGVLTSHTTDRLELVVDRLEHATFNPIFHPDALDAPPPRS